MAARRYVRLYCQAKCHRCGVPVTWKSGLEPSGAEVGAFAPMVGQCHRCGGEVLGLGVVIGAWHGSGWSGRNRPSTRSALAPDSESGSQGR